MKKHLFIFGLGYSGQAIARAAKAAGFAVSGTTRQADLRRALVADGVAAHDFPLIDESVLDGVTHILGTAAPGEGGDPALALYADQIGRVPWAGYLSTTGVYGDWQGAWVDETSFLKATSARSVRRIAAEKAWAAAAPHTHIFRLAGIYGPGRSAFDRLQSTAAQRVVKPGHMFGRIHVDDIARIVVAACLHPHPGEVFNLNDDEPAEPAKVIEEAARLMGADMPPAIEFADADLSPMAQSFWADNRKVRNDKVKAAFGPLTHPTYREGLAAIRRHQLES